MNCNVMTCEHFDSAYINNCSSPVLIEKCQSGMTLGSKYHTIAASVADIVVEKQKAYGDAVGKVHKYIELLWPDGVPVEAYPDMLALVRDFDKSMRIATDRDAMGENPWMDKAGYCLLSLGADNGK